MITHHDLDLFWGATFQDHDLFKYCVYQIEECPKTGSWHAQIFIQFKRSVRGSTVQSLMGGGNPHIEVVHHPKESRDYCMKEETRVTPYESYGKWDPRYTQGHRSDLTLAKMDIREHANYRKCLDDNSLDTITARHPRWVQDQLSMVHRGIRAKPIVTVYYGPTQTGKTLRCFNAAPGVHKLFLSGGFINYSGQSHVLLDEFDKTTWPFELMLQLMDQYPMQVNVKNGYCWWEVTHIYITATTAPRDWFLGSKGYTDAFYPQLERRLTTVTNTADEMNQDV